MLLLPARPEQNSILIQYVLTDMLSCGVRHCVPESGSAFKHDDLVLPVLRAEWSRTSRIYLSETLLEPLLTVWRPISNIEA